MASLDRVFDVFSDAQNSSMNHKSLTKRLRKLEEKHSDNKTAFDERVKQCAIRCLEVTKSERAGQNIVKFICMYCSATQVDEPDEEIEEQETTNITNQIMVAVLPYMSAKDKIIRYRSTQIVSQLMGIVQARPCAALARSIR